MVFTIEVGYTTTRPVIPDEHISWVIVEADSAYQAETIAAQMAGLANPFHYSEMSTSTTILEVR